MPGGEGSEKKGWVGVHIPHPALFFGLTATLTEELPSMFIYRKTHQESLDGR